MVIFCPLGIGLGHKEFDGYTRDRPKTTRVLLLLQVLAEDDEDGFLDHWDGLKTKALNTKRPQGLAEDEEVASVATE